MRGKRFVSCLSLLMCISVGLSPAPSAAQRQPNSTDDYVNYERDFLRALYPELDPQSRWITFEWAERYDQPNGAAEKVFLVDVGAGAKFSIVGCCYGGSAGGLVIPPSMPYDKDMGPAKPPLPPPPQPVAEPPHPTQFLSSTFVFDSKGSLNEFFRKREIPTPDLSIVFQVRAYPDITDKELMAVYKNSGAKYDLGDRKAFERDLPIGRLEEFLGKLKKVRTEFERTEYDATPDDRLSKLGYFDICRVFLEAAREGGTPLEYRADFEPKRGELVELRLLTQKQ